MTEPTDAELTECYKAANGEDVGKAQPLTTQRIFRAMRAAIAKWGAPQQEAQEPCPTCIALARTVMLDQVSFDRKPDCYGIRQITDDEGIEEWEDIRTSPDVARMFVQEALAGTEAAKQRQLASTTVQDIAARLQEPKP